eukprot:TRINITY_DN20924_c0_g1_i1.p1 TRINITY_DN20924_c0_g1~~TRINITY_DN20924_c0_g1_i1.p1  ORF type:complete len:352 (-),score=76.49 TRINITY_DN20924_c0_g1_i1:147-1202(-)
MGKNKHAGGSRGSGNAAASASKAVDAKKSSAAAATSVAAVASASNSPGGVAVATEKAATISVGASLEVTRDYVDMEKVPTVGDLTNCGYLVLRCGDEVRVLYLGSERTEDTGWAYGEILRRGSAGKSGSSKANRDEVGVRGWFPTTSVEPKVADTAENKSTASAGTSTLSAPTAAPPAAKTKASAGSAKASKRLVAPAATVAAEAFPPLAGNACIGSNEASTAEPKRWVRGNAAWGANAADGEDGSGSPERKQEPAPRSPADVAAAIAAHRAAAAKALAMINAKDKGAPRCPICSEPYSTTGRRRLAVRPCCGAELCAHCDHKNLRSSNCYFCRKEGDDFPALGVACRVSA